MESDCDGRGRKEQPPVRPPLCAEAFDEPFLEMVRKEALGLWRSDPGDVGGKRREPSREEESHYAPEWRRQTEAEMCSWALPLAEMEA